MKRNVLITAIFLGLIVIFASLKSVWEGFLYFALSSFCLLCLYWGVILSFYYYVDYYQNYQDDFSRFRAEMINSTNLTAQEFDDNLKFYIKKHRRSRLIYKFIDIFKIVFFVSLIALSIFVMVKYI